VLFRSFQAIHRVGYDDIFFPRKIDPGSIFVLAILASIVGLV